MRILDLVILKNGYTVIIQSLRLPDLKKMDKQLLV